MKKPYGRSRRATGPCAARTRAGTGRTTPEQRRLTHARGDASARVRRAPGRRPESPRRTRTSYLLATAPRPPGPATARARTLPHVAVGPVRSQQRAARPGRWSRGRALASDPPLDARRVLGERSGAGLAGRGRPRARAGGDDVAVGNRVRARARASVAVACALSVRPGAPGVEDEVGVGVWDTTRRIRRGRYMSVSGPEGCFRTFDTLKSEQHDGGRGSSIAFPCPPGARTYRPHRGALAATHVKAALFCWPDPYDAALAPLCRPPAARSNARRAWHRRPAAAPSQHVPVH